MILENWFPTPIWYEEGLDQLVNFDLIETKCQELKETTLGRIKSNIGGWQSEDINLKNIPELQPLFQIIIDRAKSATPVILREGVAIQLANAWVNINQGKDINLKHTHPGCILSGSVYVKSSLNSGAIRFMRPDLSPHYLNNVPIAPNFSQMVAFNPTRGKLILFPSWIEHDVEPSTDEETRISISFNFITVNMASNILI
jgi:uncharacterized protein (TIGR02466 family)